MKNRIPPLLLFFTNVFIEEVLTYKSIAIVGLAKNTGKTECLNYILRQIKNSGKRIALTSIGIDGEKRDQVCQTPKPEIEVQENMLFITSEKHFREKQLIAEIMDISSHQTSLGRLITARAISSGKILLSGPARANSMKQLIEEMRRFDVDTTIVDGALSRLSIGSPAVTDAMILATGAALSCNIPQLVRMTKYVHDRIHLPLVSSEIANKLTGIENGIWAIDERGEIHDLHIPSVFMLGNNKERMFQHGNTLYVAGVVSEQLLQFLRQQKHVNEITLIIKDFTKVFATMETFYAYLKRGGKMYVLYSSKLLAVCVNPLSPNGMCLDSEELREVMQESLGIPIYDVKKMENNYQS